MIKSFKNLFKETREKAVLRKCGCIELSREEINELSYPVVVEGWDKRKFGRVQRAWLAEFTINERKRAKKYYDRFYHWSLVKGTPENVKIRPEVLAFWNKLINFFGSI